MTTFYLLLLQDASSVCVGGVGGQGELHLQERVCQTCGGHQGGFDGYKCMLHVMQWTSPGSWGYLCGTKSKARVCRQWSAGTYSKNVPYPESAGAPLVCWAAGQIGWHPSGQPKVSRCWPTPCGQGRCMISFFRKSHLMKLMVRLSKTPNTCLRASRCEATSRKKS